MNNGFAKGVLIGSVIAASVSMAMKNDMISNRSRRKMMRSGRNMLRRSGRVLVNVVDMLK